jgi:pimeloyl-ACP methyl ester carboxylesterase
MSRRRALVFSLLSLTLVPALLPASPALALGIVPTVQCQRESVPVNLSPSDPTVYQLVGWACWLGSAAQKPVEVLVPGFTYDHTYWDFPYSYPTYSYVHSAAMAGYVTFAIDRLGTGQSSYPPSTLLTAPAHVYALHQVVGYLRGQFPGVPVVSVGHSAGSGTVIQEAATYADVNGVIVTGLLHEPQPVGAQLFVSFYPADLDPAFQAAGLDPGYLTTEPGTRGADFYNVAYADPLVIAQDEATKSTGSDTELSTGDTAFLASTSQAIQVPVLLAVGQYDNSFCNDAIGLSCDNVTTLLNREAQDYSSAPCLQAYVLPLAGHDINLHPDAGQWYAAANAWVSRQPGIGC